jgi:hypothetical protein
MNSALFKKLLPHLVEKIVDGPAEEIQLIGITYLEDTPIVQKTFSNDVAQPQWDSAAVIKFRKLVHGMEKQPEVQSR